MLSSIAPLTTSTKLLPTGGNHLEGPVQSMLHMTVTSANTLWPEELPASAQTNHGTMRCRMVVVSSCHILEFFVCLLVFYIAVDSSNNVNKQK